MERKKTIPAVEESVASEDAVERFVTALGFEELVVTQKMYEGRSDTEIAGIMGLTCQELLTIRRKIERKAETYLK